ncbi:MAG TPA: hypothetical protein VE954_21560 [Oligoflexus sp.]|uniref:hypothetical protein n=1 Tax=Oligoflexus sp. TaxID=1971216 RepID=UPI002D73FAA9|nr:hypothetical protein [Oligoflexus sp.]HYX35692.1 hypothetical protein [Oligoflexus sp.]
MKIPILDLGVLAKYLLPATILAGIVIYLFIRSIVVFFWQATHSTKVQKKVGELRKKQAKPSQVVVRKTDLFAQLTSEQRKVYARAKELAELQQFVEAAKLFESINFQRKAIDLLEVSGNIEEACGILLRMGVPYRAAVLYERNGYFQKAGEYFLRDGKLDQAGRCFERLGDKDFNYYRRAAECYLKAGLIDNTLVALSRLDANRDVLSIALEHERFNFLQRYLDLPFHAQTLLSELTVVQVEGLVKSLPMTPQAALSAAHWTMYRPDEPLIVAVLQKLAGNKELAQLFWSRLDDSFCEFICGLLPTLAKKPPVEVLLLHIEALLAIGRLPFAERLREVAGESAAPKPPTLAIGL